MLWEMMVLEYIARRLYKQPVADLSNSKGQTAVHICPVIPCMHNINGYIENNNHCIGKY